MPIRIDKKLPAVEILRTENIFVMDDQRADPPRYPPFEDFNLKSYATKKWSQRPSCCAIWLIHPCNWILIFSIWKATVLKQLAQSTWRPSIKLS